VIALNLLIQLYLTAAARRGHSVQPDTLGGIFNILLIISKRLSNYF
jgi:hypothetical protein